MQRSNYLAMVVAVALLFSFPVYAATEPATREVSVAVSDEKGGISGATVKLVTSGTAFYQGVTDNSGGCVIAGVVDGAYTVEVSKTGYEPYRSSMQVNASNTSHSARLAALAVTQRDITITVRDKNGSVANATVEFSADTFAVFRQNTNDSGACKFTGVPEGAYNLRISKAGYRDYTATLNVNQQLEQNPYVAELTASSSSQNVIIAVSDEDDRPISGADITLSDRGSVLYATSTNSNGNGSLWDVQDGSYTLAVSKNGHRTDTSTIRVSSGTNHYQVRLRSAQEYQTVTPSPASLTYAGSGSVTYTIPSPASPSSFRQATISGNQVKNQVIPANQLSLTDGSCVVAIQEAFLQTLANGSYTIRFEFSTCGADASLAVNKPAESPQPSAPEPSTPQPSPGNSNANPATGR